MKMNVYHILSLILVFFGGWFIARGYYDAEIKRKDNRVAAKDTDLSEMRRKVQDTEWKLRRLGPLIYPISIDPGKINIVTVDIDKVGSLIWEPHEFQVMEFIWDFRKWRDARMNNTVIRKTEDELAMEYIKAHTGFTGAVNTKDWYTLVPVINLLNYDKAREYYDWNAKMFDRYAEDKK